MDQNLSSQPSQDLADTLADFLRSKGVSIVFGVPGGENVHLIDSLRRCGIRFFLQHHEMSAGFAADVWGELTGTPGVCMATAGPGAMNLLAGAASATLERSPVLAITAEVDQEIDSRILHMNVDQVSLFTLVAKGSFSLRVETCLQVLETAWRLALAPPHGAVHLALSPEQAKKRVPPPRSNQVDNPGPARASNTEDRKIQDEPGDQSALADLIGQVNQAERPILLAGIDLRTKGGGQALRKLAEAWGVPVAVTPKAKGYFPESHPLFCGCFSAYGDPPLRQALEDADLIVGFGLDGVDIVTSSWTIQTPVVNISSAKADDPVFRPILAVDGDLESIIPALVSSRDYNSGAASWASQIRTAIQAELMTGFDPPPGKIGVGSLIAALKEVLPPDGIVTLDVGAFKLVFLQAWNTDLPKTLFVANGMSAMGYALPGALAAKLARPEIPAVAVIGDGALLMYAGELASAARLGLPLIILVIVDEALALIRLKQLRQNVPFTGTEFESVNYEALAGAFGLGYRLIDGVTAAREVLREAIQHGGPLIVEARIDVREYDHFR